MLNDAQKTAVGATEGPLLVLAGAGAGKTKTITHRILHLIKKGVAPENILAVTFTNKAAAEMKERLDALLKENPEINRPISVVGLPFVGTFHSLCVKIIKENAKILSAKRHFSIYDRSDSKKAVKESLKQLGFSEKEFDPSKVLSIISREKGNLVSKEEFAAREGNEFFGGIVARTWVKYEAILKKENAYDFDDLLVVAANLLQNNEQVRNYYLKIWRYIHIDEYQDTNEVQYKIMKLLAGGKGNICVVGDIDQCLTANTMITMADGKTKPIDEAKRGEYVLSNYGSGDFRPARIIRKQKRFFKGKLVRIETTRGKTLTSTPEHIHFAGYRLGLTPQMHFCYLMYKKEVGWRIGATQVYTNSQKKPVIGFVQRCNQEHADSAWIISTHKTSAEARVQEYILSLKYQIPTLPFTPRKGASIGGYVHDKISIAKIFSSFNTRTAALKLLSDFGLPLAHPHYRPQARNSNRRNINVTLCADRRGKTPMHLISFFGNDESGKKSVESLGFSIRSAKPNTKNWRFETVHADYGKVCLLATRISSIFPDAQIIFKARLGGKKVNIRDGNSLPCLPAMAITPGMALFSEDGGYDIVSKTSQILSSRSAVYDLDIEKTHNFIANGIFTHNCIYSWRGANIRNILNFEKDYPVAKLVVLEENYRSTQTILAVANRIIEKNKLRRKKVLFTANALGEKIGLFEALDESQEAAYVAEKVKIFQKKGVPLSEIAVLYRANFQSRALEEACLKAQIPYQVVGTRFFERKEIKDVIAFIRYALNPESTTDLARIINVPPRGIGKVTLLKIVEGKEEALPVKIREKVFYFRKTMAKIKEFALTKKPSETVKFVIEVTELGNALSKSEEDIERIENLKELAALAGRYDTTPGEEGVENFLSEVALVSDQDAMKDEERVRLMTVHASKGLEFETVFITGLEEGLFPSDKDRDREVSAEEAEEERRLFYVALTRAKKKIFLSYAQSRAVYGNRGVNIPSEFIFDIPEAYIEREYFDYIPRRKPLLDIQF